MMHPKDFTKQLASDLVQTFGRGVFVSVAAVAVATIAFLVAIGNLVYPYHPISVYKYEAVPMEVCPGGEVDVRQDWEVRDDLRAFRVSYQWSERGSPTAAFGGEAHFENVKASPRETVRSPLIRAAPPTPGMWRLETNYDAFGTRLGMPVRQDLDNITSEDFVTVKDNCGGET